MFEIGLKGFLVFAAIIAAIGGQNAFVLRQALMRNHTLLICTICATCDFILIFIGVFGLGSIVNQSEYLLLILVGLGISFLVGFALKSFYNAYQNRYDFQLDKQKNFKNLNQTVLATLAVTLLNPHVYLDTVLIVGGIGATYEGIEKFYYAIGASLASVVWFLLLGLAAKVLVPFFKKNRTWQILDVVIGLIMLYIAYDLLSFIKN